MMADHVEHRPVVLSLATLGSPEWPRYAISDQFGRYWTGAIWSADEQQAWLFADANEACQEMQWLLKVEYSDCRKRQFCVPVRIDLYSNEEVSLEQLQAWLFKTARLLIDSPRHGNGPVSGSLGTCQIDWGELKEVT